MNESHPGDEQQSRDQKAQPGSPNGSPIDQHSGDEKGQQRAYGADNPGPLSGIGGYLKQQHLTEWIQVACTIAIVVITFYYTTYAHAQADLLRKTLQEMNAQSKEIKRSADATEVAAKAASTNATAAQTAADAAIAANTITARGVRQNIEATRIAADALKVAQDSNAYSRESFRMDQRPWLLVSQTDFPEFVQPLSEINAEITIQNVGRSPALAVEPQGILNVAAPRAPMPPLHFQVCNLGGCEPEAIDSIGATIQRKTILRRTITEDDFGLLEHSDASLLIIGTISYKDIFGDNHFTQYCYQSRRADLATPRLTFVLCPGRNEAK